MNYYIYSYNVIKLIIHKYAYIAIRTVVDLESGNIWKHKTNKGVWNAMKWILRVGTMNYTLYMGTLMRSSNKTW